MGRVILALGVTAALALSAAAQLRPPKSTLRAIAVVELFRDAKGNLGSRLVPVTIMVEDKFYDAGLYKATPQPFVLEPGTVYEAERGGVSAGLFTVEQTARQSRFWYGLGAWEPAGAAPPPKEKVVVRGTSEPDEDAPPKIRRPGSSTPAAGPPPAEAPPPPPAPARPVTPPPAEEDPNRPILRRGPPKAQKALEPFTPLAGEAQTGERGPAASERMVAVSDTAPSRSRPYAFLWTRDEEERLTNDLRAMARAEIAKYAAARPGPRRPPAGELEDVRVRAFDMNYDNVAEIVLTARQAAAPPASSGKTTTPGAADKNYFVTVVAKTEIGGELRKLLGYVTDSHRLDSMPRLELLDAVDAEGDGVGDLLFRRIGATTQSYELFRVGHDSLWSLFRGAEYDN